MDIIGGLVQKLFEALVPPPDADPVKVHRWYWAVFMLLLAIGGLSVANTIVIFGIWPAIFGAGLAPINAVNDIKQAEHQFVTKGDIQNLERSLNTIADNIKQSRIGTLSTQMYNLRVQQCAAIHNGNPSLAQSHDQQLIGLEFEWRQLTGYEYTRRPCSEL